MSKKIKIIFYLSFLLVFLVSGCTSRGEKSDLCNLDFVVETQNVVIRDKIIDIIVDYEVETYDYKNKLIISEKATTGIYLTIELKTKVEQMNLQIGENEYFLKITAEDGKTFKTYKINIYRLNQFNVNYSLSDQYEFTALDGETLKTKIKENEDLFFKVDVEEGLDVVVRINNVEVVSQGGVYSKLNVNANLIITAELIQRSFQIQFPEYAARNGYDIRILSGSEYIVPLPNLNFNYGEDLSFKVYPKTDFEGSFIIFNNNVGIEGCTLSSGQVFCDIYNIKNKVVITVDDSNIKRKLFPVIFQQDERIQIKDSLGNIIGSNVNKGEDFTFEIEIKEGYLGSIGVTINGGTKGICNVGDLCERTVSKAHLESLKKLEIEIDYSNLRESIHEINFTVQGEGAFFIPVEGETLPTSVLDAQSFAFKIQLIEGYEGNFNVTARGDIIVPIGEIYTIDNVSGYVTVLLDTSGLVIKHLIQLPEISNMIGYEILPLEGKTLPTSIVDGESFSFYVNLLEGYKGTLIIKINGNVVEKIDDMYTINNINEGLQITVEGASIITFDVTYSGDKQKFEIIAYENNYIDEIEYGNNLYFIINIINGYEGTFSQRISSNLVEEVSCDQNNLCLIENIKRNVTVYIDTGGLQLSKMAISLPELSDIYLISDEEDNILPLSVEYGSQLSFKVTINSDFYQGDLIVKINDQIVQKDNLGLYSIIAKSQIFISIDQSNVTRINYVLNYNTSDEFNLKLLSGEQVPSIIYKGEILDIVLYFNESHEGYVELIINEFTLKTCQSEAETCEFSIIGNGSVEIFINSFLEIKTFDVIYQTEGEANSFLKTQINGSPVTWGETISFSLKTNEGYRGQIYVTAGGQEIIPTFGVYLIENVKSVITVVIDASELFIAYNISLPSQMNGYQILMDDGTQIPGFIKKDIDFSFMIEIEESYDGEIISVLVNDSVIECIAGFYNISKETITSDLQIKIESNLQIRKYNVIFEEERPEDKYQVSITGNGIIEYGESISFEVNVKEGFVGELIINLISDGDYEFIKVGTTYRIENIKDEIEIMISDLNIEVITYQIVYPTLSGSGYLIYPLEDEELLTEVSHNGSVSFIIEKSENYQGNIKVIVGEDEIIESDGVYTVNNIKKDTTIEIDLSNYFVITYQLSWTKGDGYSVLLLNNDPLPSSVEKGSDLEFKLFFNTSYQGSVEVWVNDVKIGECFHSDLDCSFSKTNIQGSVSINIIDEYLSVVEYDVSWTTIDGVEIQYVGEEDDLPSKVLLNKSISFKVILNEDYEGNYLVYNNNELINKDVDNMYMINYVTGNVNVRIEGQVTKKEFDVTILEIDENQSGQGFSILEASNKARPNQNYSFVVEYENGYDIENSVVEYNGITLDKQKYHYDRESYKYTINNVSFDIVIEINISIIYYNISFPTGDGYSIEYETDTVDANTSNFEFTITYDANFSYYPYELSFIENNQTFKFRECDISKDELNPNKYKYIKEDFSADIEIVTYVYYKNFLVVFSGKSFLMTGVSTPRPSFFIQRGSDYSFKLLNHEDFDLTGTPIVKVNNVEIQATNDIYTVPSVTKQLNINIGGLVENELINIEFGSLLSYQIIPFEGSQSKKRNPGGDFKFTIEATFGYDISDSIVSYVDVKLDKDQDGVYTIENVVKTDFIKVTNIKAIAYTINLYGEGVEFLDLDGKKISSTESISPKNEFKFKIKLKDYYEGTPIVKLNAETVINHDQGVYSISITQDSSIDVECIQKTNYNINYVTNEKFEYVKYLENDLLTSIEAEENLFLGVKIGLNYQKGDNFKVSYAGKIISVPLEIDNINNIYYYYIGNIIESGSIVVEGIEDAS